ncbi:glycosyltransferase family 2 protein [Trichocoleus sp. ST-U3]|uniref:glycosyltransferase family 2 protein n=1 Tax=Coleofasciculus sp. FACHB-542 TaxID=2692787 RepID=UPI00168442FA|nr:glycosyltransferase family A protein [Coleofasciculus sp. FACHB-542]MBD2084112.1 glycosyltransferase family 2 protein [Coleofasciculus sp. FACHB-542]
MENRQLFVSVIIPVYNGEKFLSEVIFNVKTQEYQPLEIIIVDDGSTDGTAEVAAQFKNSIRYVYQDNSGPAAARNRVLSIAKGDAIAFLDVDDLWSEDKLKLQVGYLVDNPSVEIVQGLIQQMKLCQITTNNQPLFEPAYNPYSYINLGSAIYRRLVFDKIGLFDETLNYAEDVDWFIRAWENGISKVVLERVSLFYRKHEDNMTVGKNLVELGFVRIFKKHLDRCRKRGNSQMASLLDMPINEYLGTSPEIPKIM